MAKLHTQRGLRGFLLDVPPADWGNHNWKDHEPSNRKNMSCNCFARVFLLVQHSLIWHVRIFGKPLWHWDVFLIPCISSRNTCFETWKGNVGAIFPLNHSPIEVGPHLRFKRHPFPMIFSSQALSGPMHARPPKCFFSANSIGILGELPGRSGLCSLNLLLQRSYLFLLHLLFQKNQFPQLGCLMFRLQLQGGHAFVFHDGCSFQLGIQVLLLILFRHFRCLWPPSPWPHWSPAEVPVSCS